MKLELQNNISSRQDLKAIIIEIKSYAQWYSQVTVKMKFDKNASYEQPSVSEAAYELITSWSKEKPLNQKNLDELIAELEDYAATAPAITITLAAPPPRSLKKTLTDWCRQNIDPNMLVDFKFNATMLGGMVVQHGSHVYDWSFRRQILDKRYNFAEVLKSV